MKKQKIKSDLIIVGLLFLALFLFFLLPPIDPDLGWHLRCGQEIWQQKGFCSQNRFSVLLENYSWTNHHWLYQIVLFPVYKLAGFWGLSVLGSFIISLSLLIFYLAIKNSFLEKIIATILVILFSGGVFSLGVRSQLSGFLFFNFLLLIFSRIEKKFKLIWFFPLVMLVWANSHGSFVLGLILIGFFWLRQLIIFLFSIKGWSRSDLADSRRLILFTASAASCFLITLANPFGFGVYQEAWRHLTGSIDLSKLIAEWVPPGPWTWWLVLASGIWLFLYILIKAEGKNKIFSFLILPFIFLACKARRHTSFYFVLFFYFLLTITPAQNFLSNIVKNKRFKIFLAFSLILIFLAIGLVRLPKTASDNSSWENYCRASSLDYPYGAVEFLKAQPAVVYEGIAVKENIYNRYEWGGFLIWQLPEYKIFVDGRMPAWPLFSNLSTSAPKSPYTVYLEVIQTQSGWQQTLEQYRIQWILISPGTFMDLLLAPEPGKFGWQEVFRDSVSVVYKKLTN